MQIQDQLNQLLNTAQEHAACSLGYPVSQDFDYSLLAPFLNIPFNNIGDPFVESTYGVNSLAMEREVLNFFASLFRAPKDEWWGYVTNGGSEGNLYSLYLAREKYPNGIIYYSDSTHYSIRKNIHVLGCESIAIKSQPNGEMDYDDFARTIEMHRNVPVIVVANIGTTMKEACDDIKKIRKIIRNTAIQHHYIHSDAALSGVIKALSPDAKPFDFMDGADSITISGHKFIGSPIPCGVVIVKKANRDRIALSISYTGSMDTTITGSRNGLSPIVLWTAIQQWGKEGLKKRVQHSQEMAQYAEKKLQESGVECWRNTNAITLVIPPQPQWIKDKWQLATEESCSHIICMPNVQKHHLDPIIKAIAEKGNHSFPSDD